MDQALSRLRDHLGQGTTDVAASTHRWSSASYVSPDTYRDESARLGDGLPLFLGPAQELGADAGSFVLREAWNVSWLVRRADDATFSAFLNRCRHRGRRLVDQPKGKLGRITCPYHGWAYRADDGVCAFIPERASAFPDLEPSEIRLHSRPVLERGGLLWLRPAGGEATRSPGFLDPLEPHFQAWDLASYRFHSSESLSVAANWKIAYESFLEAYHVPFVHRTSLAPATVPNAWLFDYYGPHSRAIYPLARLKGDPTLAQAPFHQHVSVLYQVFPNAFVSFQPFHAFTMSFWPLSADQTRIELVRLEHPADRARSPALIEREVEHIRKGLLEDVTTAERIQAALGSGPDEELVAGRYEGQIAHFHAQLEAAGVRLRRG
jgi:phenylpropionate dioxygenase-like ring-hydroxylating dioxygenase large terminal subunit